MKRKYYYNDDGKGEWFFTSEFLTGASARRWAYHKFEQRTTAKKGILYYKQEDGTIYTVSEYTR